MTQIILVKIRIVHLVLVSITLFLVITSIITNSSDNDTIFSDNSVKRWEINQADNVNTSVLILTQVAEATHRYFYEQIDNATIYGPYGDFVNFTVHHFETVLLEHVIETVQAFIDEVNFDLVIGVGFVFFDRLYLLAIDNPGVNFAVIDTIMEGELPNTRSVIFKEHEGTFLLGIIAALATATDKIGFIGGVDIELINKFQSGFDQGARFVNPNIYTRTEYICPDSGVPNAPCDDNPWFNLDAGYHIADDMLEEEIDIIFPAASNSGTGVFNRLIEARDEGLDVFGMGTDGPFEGMYPNTSISSWVKRYDTAIQLVISDYMQDQWNQGIVELGIVENGTEVTYSNVDKFQERFDCPEDFSPQQYIDIVVEMIREGSLTIDPGLQDLEDYNEVGLTCKQMSDIYYERVDPPWFYIGITAVTVLTLGLVFGRFISMKFRGRNVKLTYNNNIQNIISPSFNQFPELISYFLIPGTIKNEKVLSQFNDEVPAQLLEFKHLIHPIRLAITKLLFEFGDFSTQELRDRLGISWDELNNNLKALRRKDYVFTTREVREEGLTYVVSLNIDKISEYKEIMSLLIEFLTSTPNLELYVDNAEDLLLQEEDRDLYPSRRIN